MSVVDRPDPAFAAPPMGVALLGAAHIHTPTLLTRLLARPHDIALHAVYDHDMGRAVRALRDFPYARLSTAYEGVLADPSITVVVVCAETRYHSDLVIAAAAAGKHVFCEKPLGLGAHDAQAMARAVVDAGIVFQTGFLLRSDPVHQFVAAEVAAGHLGKITRVRYVNAHQAILAGWFADEWQWMTDPAHAGGGAMLDLGIHMLDLILHTFSSTEGTVVQVAGSLSHRVGGYGSAIDEYGSALITFASGAIAVIEASWIDPTLRSAIEVFGTEGQIQITDEGIRYWSSHRPEADGRIWRGDLPRQAPHPIDLFWDTLRGLPIPIPLVRVDEAAAASALMERIYTAAGRPIASTGAR